MSESAISKITSKGQVTIPERIRGNLKLQPGDRLEWQTRTDGVIELRPLSNTLEGLIGILRTPTRKLTLEEIDDVLKQRHGRIDDGER